MSDELSALDIGLLRSAINFAAGAGESGELPFGAVIAAHDGTVMVEAISTEISDADWTCHAEMNAIRMAGPKFPRASLAKATIYASSEPCAMCASAIFTQASGALFSASANHGSGSCWPQRKKLQDWDYAAARCWPMRPNRSTFLAHVWSREAAIPHDAFWTSFLAKASAGN